MAINNFKPSKFEDFEIVDGENKKVGAIRVKPSGVLWQPKGSHSWFGLTLKQFGDYAEASGKKQDK